MRSLLQTVFLLVTYSVVNGQSCTSSNYNTATSDTIPSQSSVPTALANSEYQLQEIDLTTDYNLFQHCSSCSSNDPWGYQPTSSDSTTNTIVFNSGLQGFDDPDPANVWNNTLFPGDNAEGFFPIYPTYDHTDVWHKITFEIKQGQYNEINWGTYECNVYPKLGIFDKDKLDINENADEIKFPNTVNSYWTDGPFCTRAGDDGTSCFEIELHDDSIADGITLETNYNDDNVWIQFPSSTGSNTVVYEVTFKFVESVVCTNCFPVIMIENNGWARWNTEVEFQISSLTLERLSNAVTFETPITDFYSEIVEIPRVDSLSTIEAAGWDRTDCPHQWSNLYEWHESNTWDSGNVPSTSDSVIEIPENKNVIIRSCSLDSDENNPYQRIYVPSTSSLIFDDADINIHFKEIYVDGNLYVGNEQCRLYSNINFYFYGTKSNSNLGSTSTFNENDNPQKGIVVNGNIQVHGKQYHPTWTKLAMNAYAGADRIYLQESVNWEVGQEILIVTSIYQDYEYSHQNEIRTITAIGDSDWATDSVVYFGDGSDDPDLRLNHHHYCGIEYQTEVLLLTRRIVFEGKDIDSDDFGGHTKVQGTDSTGQFRGVLAYNMGQKNVLARYPFHAHMMETTTNTIFTDTSVVNSFFRCWTIHGSHEVTLSHNTAYNIDGHCMYLEDGVEENNIIEYNAVSHIHPIGRNATGSCQQGETVCVDCNNGADYTFTEDELLVPADVGASAYYISNAYNTIKGNIASGGWAGFSFINMKEPLGNYLGTGCTDFVDCPYNRPTLEFDGNTAHSSGFYWGDDGGCGSCIYVGGEMWYEDSENSYYYFTAREEHEEFDSSTGEEVWNSFTNIKTYLCDMGTNYWGSRVIIDGLESYDSQRGVFFLGETVLKNALLNAHSGNILGGENAGEKREGFEFYDTGVKTFLKNIKFRNFQSGEGQIMFLTSVSDAFTPEVNAIVDGISYDNCDDGWKIIDYHCGAECNVNLGVDNTETQASRTQTMYDYDGTASGKNLPAIVTTKRSWWEFNDDCEYDSSLALYYCPWYEKKEGKVWEYDSRYHNVAHVDIYIPGLTESDAEDVITGYLSQWGRNYSTLYSAYPGATGWTNMGWYFRSINGAPETFQIGPDLQIPRKSFIVLAMRYPSTAQFNVYMKVQWDTYQIDLEEAASYEEITESGEDLYDDWLMWDCSNVNDYRELCQTTGGYGPKWYFDGEFLYLRIVNPYWYTQNYYQKIDEGAFYWEYDNMRIWDLMAYVTYYVEVTSCSGCSSSVSGYYDCTDYLPDQFPTQSWESTGYWDDATPQPTKAPYHIGETPAPTGPTKEPTSSPITSCPASICQVYEEIDLTYGYNYYTQHSAIWGWEPTSEDSSTNMIEFDGGTYGSGNTALPPRLWNGTIFPQEDAEKLPEMYSSYNGDEIWYKITFELQQGSNNQINFGTNENHVNLYLSIFNEIILNNNENSGTDTYPRTVGSEWDEDFCKPVNGLTSCQEIILHQDSIDNGITLTQNNIGDDVWITFPSSTGDSWVINEVTFKFKETDVECTSCFFAMDIYNNGWPKWNSDILWRLRQFTVEAIFESPTPAPSAPGLPTESPVLPPTKSPVSPPTTSPTGPSPAPTNPSPSPTNAPTPATSPPTASPTPAQAPFELRLLCGNAATDTYTDSSGNQWVGGDDSYITSSSYGSYDTSNSISNTNDDYIYQTERNTGSTEIVYEIVVDNGLYDITLHFAELYFTSRNKRKFDVSIEGTQVINDLDIYDDYGTYAAATFDFTSVIVSDGILTIEFTQVIEQPKVNGIEITSSGTPAPTSPTNPPTPATPAPTGVTTSPTGPTNSPTPQTPAPTGVTPSPTSPTNPPTPQTPAPTGVTAEPSNNPTRSPTPQTPAPTDATPAPTGVTPSPTVVSSNTIIVKNANANKWWYTCWYNNLANDDTMNGAWIRLNGDNTWYAGYERWTNNLWAFDDQPTLDSSHYPIDMIISNTNGKYLYFKDIVDNINQDEEFYTDKTFAADGYTEVVQVKNTGSMNPWYYQCTFLNLNGRSISAAYLSTDSGNSWLTGYQSSWNDDVFYWNGYGRLYDSTPSFSMSIVTDGGEVEGYDIVITSTQNDVFDMDSGLSASGSLTSSHSNSNKNNNFTLYWILIGSGCIVLLLIMICCIVRKVRKSKDYDTDDDYDMDPENARKITEAMSPEDQASMFVTSNDNNDDNDNNNDINPFSNVIISNEGRNKQMLFSNTATNAQNTKAANSPIENNNYNDYDDFGDNGNVFAQITGTNGDTGMTGIPDMKINLKDVNNKKPTGYESDAIWTPGTATSRTHGMSMIADFETPRSPLVNARNGPAGGDVDEITIERTITSPQQIMRSDDSDSD